MYMPVELTSNRRTLLQRNFVLQRNECKGNTKRITVFRSTLTVFGFVIPFRSAPVMFATMSLLLHLLSLREIRVEQT